MMLQDRQSQKGVACNRRMNNVPLPSPTQYESLPVSAQGEPDALLSERQEYPVELFGPLVTQCNERREQNPIARARPRTHQLGIIAEPIAHQPRRATVP